MQTMQRLKENKQGDAVARPCDLRSKLEQAVLLEFARPTHKNGRVPERARTQQPHARLKQPTSAGAQARGSSPERAQTQQPHARLKQPTRERALRPYNTSTFHAKALGLARPTTSARVPPPRPVTRIVACPRQFVSLRENKQSRIAGYETRSRGDKVFASARTRTAPDTIKAQLPRQKGGEGG